jgi:hypothetical protein
MSVKIQSALGLLVLITVSAPVQMSLADDAAITEKQELDKEQLKRWNKFYQREASEYDIFLGGAGGEKLQFLERPVFRWAAPMSQNEFNGVIFVWTHNGRPEVLGSIWSVASRQVKGRRNIAHTFHSLAQKPLLANRNGGDFWHPTEPGLSLKPIPQAPVPAQLPAQRRLQIRALSREFSASEEARGKQETLHMQPRPIYEYETDQGSGAIFTFLRDWDPEVMLIIEARETVNGPRWHFEGIRFCVLSARMRYRDQEVWSYEHGGPMRDPKHFYFSIHGASWADRIIDGE